MIPISRSSFSALRVVGKHYTAAGKLEQVYQRVDLFVNSAFNAELTRWDFPSLSIFLTRPTHPRYATSGQQSRRLKLRSLF